MRVGSGICTELIELAPAHDRRRYQPESDQKTEKVDHDMSTERTPGCVVRARASAQLHTIDGHDHLVALLERSVRAGGETVARKEKEKQIPFSASHHDVGQAKGLSFRQAKGHHA